MPIGTPFLALLLVLVLVFVFLILIVVLIGVFVLVLVHDFSSCSAEHAARIAYPEYQDLSFGLNTKLAKSPATMAAVIPPAVPLRPPVNIPRKPCSSTAERTLLARV